MIDQLSITNIGVIEQADLSFNEGLTVITGETGAGKTMLLTAIGLIAGDRADASRVRQGANKATVDAALTDRHHAADLAAFAADVDAELDDDALLIGRTVPADGRARATLGGRHVPAGVLAELADRYITIHGQSEQLKLRSATYQREVLDAAGGRATAVALEEYTQAYRAFGEVEQRLAELQNSSQERAQRAAALSAGINQIDDVDPYVGEDDELRDKAERLTNIDEVRRSAQSAYQSLDGTPGSAISVLSEAAHNLQIGASFDPQLRAWADELATASAVATDVASQLGSYVTDLDVQPGELDAIHERRAVITQLLRLYGPTIEDALAWRESAQSELLDIDDSPEAMDRLRAEHEEKREHLEAAGAALTKARQTTARKLSSAITGELAELGMANASVRVALEAVDFATYGADRITFQLRSHAGGEYRGIGQGASGGELSRLMLAIEVCVADAGGIRGRTFVFDEIDAGIGGATATKVGARLKRLAAHHQVIVVTHVAQVAAFADGHVVIRKTDEAAGARTNAMQIMGDDKLREIARMLGGTDSDAALRHADELIRDANVAR